MAINIQSGSTWAEIRAHLNEESWNRDGDTMDGKLVLAKNPEEDMEATTKKYTEEYVNKLFEFTPGDFVELDFGQTPFETYNRITSISSSGTHPINKTIEYINDFTFLPLSNGKVKATFALGSLNIGLGYSNPSGFSHTLYIGEDNGFDCNLHVKIEVDTKVKKYTLWEEDVPSAYESSKNDNSIINHRPIITIDELDVKIKCPITLKIIITINSIKDNLHSGYYFPHVITCGCDQSSLKGYIGNPIFNTTANTYGFLEEVTTDE